jgi:hypothetical protein
VKPAITHALVVGLDRVAAARQVAPFPTMLPTFAHHIFGGPMGPMGSMGRMMAAAILLADESGGAETAGTTVL